MSYDRNSENYNLKVIELVCSNSTKVGEEKAPQLEIKDKTRDGWGWGGFVGGEGEGEEEEGLTHQRAIIITYWNLLHYRQCSQASDNSTKNCMFEV